MAKMKAVAMKVTKDIYSMKIAYEKNGKIFVRSGTDGFTTGVKVHSTVSSLGKWGFRKVIGDTYFRDAEEIIESLDKFDLDRDGNVRFHV